MCGISGIYNFRNDKTVRETDVIKMRDALRHRGPDSDGLYISPDKTVGFGFQRLSIIDLSPLGNQPMTNEDGTIWIVFNGEIYNFKELRAELEKAGHKFKSGTDTEVIIHSYEEYGVDCVKRFNGMFAFAIWNEKNKTFFAARDHIGIKPFYYAEQNGVFYFGSEIKSILAHPDFKKELEKKNISQYLTFACLPAPFTLFKDVKKLPAAHSLTIYPNGKLETREYWNPITSSLKAKIQNPKQQEEYYVSEIRRILDDSIRAQMVSDVPFGCFLSGGIDSSTNAALMTKALGKPVETFSIGVEVHEKYNEFEYSRKMAEILKAKTHEIVVNRESLLQFLLEYPKYADDPNGDQICFLVFYLSKLIRESGVIVAQVGEGADELFAGYGAYLLSVNLYEKYWRYLRRLPKKMRGLPSFLGRNIFKNPRFDFYNTYAERLALEEEPFWGNAIAFSDYQKEKLLSAKFKKELGEGREYKIIKKIYDEIDAINPEADFLERMTYLELKIRLPELLLMRVDKMAMAHSIETRVPFLDKRLVELAMRIPQKIKVKGNATKYILKKAVSGIIPDKIIWRKKQGFGAPIAEWLRDAEGSKNFTDIIFKSKLRELDVLNYDYVRALISAHQSGKVDHNFRIWNLITLSLWYDYWFE